MCAENSTWGAPRIQSELRRLGYEVAESTVAKYLWRPRKPPSQTWRTFLKNHVGELAAADGAAAWKPPPSPTGRAGLRQARSWRSCASTGRRRSARGGRGSRSGTARGGGTGGARSMGFVRAGTSRGAGARAVRVTTIGSGWDSREGRLARTTGVLDNTRCFSPRTTRR